MEEKLQAIEGHITAATSAHPDWLAGLPWKTGCSNEHQQMLATEW